MDAFNAPCEIPESKNILFDLIIVLIGFALLYLFWPGKCKMKPPSAHQKPPDHPSKPLKPPDQPSQPLRPPTHPIRNMPGRPSAVTWSYDPVFQNQPVIN